MFWESTPVSKQKANEKFHALKNEVKTFFFTLKIFSLGFTNKHPVIYYLKVN